MGVGISIIWLKGLDSDLLVARRVSVRLVLYLPRLGRVELPLKALTSHHRRIVVAEQRLCLHFGQPINWCQSTKTKAPALLIRGLLCLKLGAEDEI